MSEVAPQEDLMDRSMELAHEIARQPAKTLRMAKRLFCVAHGRTLEETPELSAAFLAVCHHSPEHARALEAMASRRQR